MSGLERALSWFVEPRAPDVRPARAGVRPASTAAVLGRPGQAEPVAAALALVLRRRESARAAGVVVLAPEESGAAAAPDPRNGMATAAARRLADRLDACGLAAEPRGRLAWVQLPAAPVQAVAAVRRATAVGAPTVLALTVARSTEVDDLLVEQDLLVVVTTDPTGPLATLAAEDLGAASSPPVAAIRPLPPGPLRALATAGFSAGRFGARLVAALGERPTGREEAL
jgi:hypothetical protein